MGDKIPEFGEFNQNDLCNIFFFDHTLKILQRAHHFQSVQSSEITIVTNDPSNVVTKPLFAFQPTVHRRGIPAAPRQQHPMRPNASETQPLQEWRKKPLGCDQNYVEDWQKSKQEKPGNRLIPFSRQ